MANDATAAKAIIERLKRMGNITVHLAPGFMDILGCATEPAASSRVTMPRLAFNRKDTSGELIGRQIELIGWNCRRFRVIPTDNARSMAASWPTATRTRMCGSRKIGHIAS
jgi:hypothetical protein